MKYVKCEDCNVELEVDDIDTYSISVITGDTATVKFLGYCPNCGTNYSWYESFDYTMFNNLRKT